MRVAIRCTRIATADELTVGPFDAERLCDLAADWEIAVFVDHESGGLGQVRDAGIDVRVNRKRVDPETGVSGDEDLVQLLADAHANRPFDAILESSDIAAQAGWMAPSLTNVPHGVFAGEGLADANAVLDDATLFRDHGRQLWAIAGHICAASFTVGDLSGFGAVSPTPPAFGLGDQSVFATHDGLDGRRIVLSALTVGAQEAGRSLVALAKCVEPDATIVVLHRDLPLSTGPSRHHIVEGLDEALRNRTVLVNTLVEPAGAEFLAAADGLAVVSPAELSVRAVAECADTNGALVVTGAAPAVPPTLAVDMIDRTDARSAVAIPYVPGELDAAVTSAIDEGADAILLFEGAIARTEALMQIDWSRTDVAVMCGQTAVLGGPDSSEVAPGVVGFSTRVAPSFLSQARDAGSLTDLVMRCVDITLTEHVRLAVVPAPVGTPTIALDSSRHEGPAPWFSSTGGLRRPLMSGGGFSVREVPVDTSVRDWASEHTFGDRVRLALPWKWGLLPKAMKDRW